MRIVDSSVTLLSVTPNAEQLIERCGRVCYKSEDRITPESSTKFIEMIRKNGHESVLEHATATLLFVCDRGVSHELVRHRLASYSQESTRYCNYSKERFGGHITVISPRLQDVRSHNDWTESCAQAEVAYFNMLDNGCVPQFARSVLPTCLKTEIAVTANFREWLHILRLRTSWRAHPQIRDLMFQAWELLRGQAPSVFSSLTVLPIQEKTDGPKDKRRDTQESDEVGERNQREDESPRKPPVVPT